MAEKKENKKKTQINTQRHRDRVQPGQILRQKEMPG